MKSYSFKQLFLIMLHKIYVALFGKYQLKPLARETDLDRATEIIYEHLISDVPCMISRFGAVEISSLANYLGVMSDKHDILGYIHGSKPEWWWNEGIRRCMTDNAGFFPNTDENLAKFGELMLDDMKQIDVLASWQEKERLFVDKFPQADFIHYTSFDCFWVDKPWTKALENKNVLVVHPFSDEIEFQYKTNRDKLFKNKDVLPNFNLITLKSVQSIGGNSEFDSWFDALDLMKAQIDNIEYDICLLGCGAYGMPLAAHIKRAGKKAIHVGGSLQLLFGIRGRRWENPLYGIEVHNEKGRYASLFNEYWIRPGEKSQVVNAEKVDDKCYW